LLLDIQVLNKLGRMIRCVDICGLGFFFCLGEVIIGGFFPMHGLVVFVVFEEGQEISDSQHEPVVIDEGLGGDLLVDLVFAPGHKFDIVDRQGRNDHVEQF
jgi:hypothetical protein